MTYEMEKQYQANRARKGEPEVTRKAALIGAGAILLVGLVIGTILGASAGSGAPAASQPQPVETVTVEVPAAVETGTCKDVAIELHDMLQTMTDKVAIPQNEALQIVVAAATSFDYSEIERATGIINGVTSTTQSLTARLTAVSPDYSRCINP